jgi:hypothetical protein
MIGALAAATHAVTSDARQSGRRDSRRPRLGWSRGHLPADTAIAASPATRLPGRASCKDRGDALVAR